MAKAKSKETSVPLIFALVFFILTTIAFGVMWYLAYSDQQTYVDKAAKAEKDIASVRSLQREAELKARLYRVYMGIAIDGVTDDQKELASDPSPAIAAELDKVNAAMAKAVGVPTAADLPAEFQFWKTDANKKLGAMPTEGLTQQIAKLQKKEEAYKAADDERASYKKEIENMQKAAKSLATVQKKFQDQIDKLPAEFKTELKKVTDGFDARTKQYQQAEASANDRLTKISNERDDLQSQIRKLNDKIIALQQNNQILQEKTRTTKADQFTYDEPQGKILRRRAEGVVEINLGSAAGVRPGLTFTVLPPDFPEKGRQSRMKMLRVPDGRGGFKSVESFVPKGAIEVYEVVGPNLSLARVQSGTELDPIREGVTVGDLLYNSVWRKGVADHIALIGIFDVNGDGSDDIENVVRGLRNMGIPVDAYYDMKKRAWVGEVTERTRYVVEGYLPINTGVDPNRDEKTKLLGAIATAVTAVKQKGVDVVNFRDFFSRIGYKFRLDVSDDKINQATAPYLSNVGVGGPMTPNP